MPTYEEMQNLYSNVGTVGQQLKQISDEVMQMTFDNDLATRLCYLYDYYNDDHKNLCTGYDPSTSYTKVPVKLKFIIKEYKSASKDEPEYHIMFTPDDWNTHMENTNPQLSWFNEKYGKYDIKFPCGLYVDIPDDRGVYWKWFIFYDEVANQFPKFGVIKCNHYFQWISNDGTHRYKRQMWGAERTQSSYTSGVWSGDRTTKLDEQSKFWLPWNQITSELVHDMRIPISMLQKKPLTYKISKIKNTAPKGVVNVTVVQTEFNEKTDYVDMKTGDMYADYYTDNVKPTDEPTVNEKERSMKIQCSTSKIRIGGDFKQLAAICYEQNDDEIVDVSNTFSNYEWSFFMNDQDISSIIVQESIDLNHIQIKIPRMSDIDELEKYVGQIITVKCKNDKAETSIELFTTL